jgi:hypothetical protein
MSRVGVVYIAFGEVYRQLTVLSISFLRRFGYSGPVRVITDFHAWDLSQLRCEVVEVPNLGDGFGTRHYKTQITKYGYDTTLFLDADTLPVSSIDDIWKQLRFADICMSVDRHPDVLNLVTRGRDHSKCTWLAGESSLHPRRAEYEYMAGLGLMQHTFYSSGVMLYRRNAATDRLFEVWHEEWCRFRHEDQLALVRAIDQSGCSVRTLSPRWNARIRGSATVESAQWRRARILHLRQENSPMLKILFEQPAFDGFGRTSRLRQFRDLWMPRIRRAIGTCVASLSRRP